MTTTTTTSLTTALGGSKPPRSLTADCAAQVEDLHRLFVQWFRGTHPLTELQQALETRLADAFSHVAPNGQFLTGRSVLLGHLHDKYACYQDRVFEIDIYNVQVVWTDGTQSLVTYEEWQSWQQEEEEDEDDEEGTQQFGRLSTCLLEKQANGIHRWIHVHETWLEDESPAPTAVRAAVTRESEDNDTVVTGPMPIDMDISESEGVDRELAVNNAIEKSLEMEEIMHSEKVEDKTPEDTPEGEEEEEEGDSNEKAFLSKSKGILVFEDKEEKEEQPAPKASADATPKAEASGSSTASAASIPNDVSKKRHVSAKLDQHAQPMMWEGALVGVSIAGFDIGTSQGPMADDAWYKQHGIAMEDAAQSISIPKPRRRICLPEMVFPVAHVALEGNGVWMSWDATDALQMWAECHQQIAVLSRIPWNGVNVLKSNDAKKWNDRRQHATNDEDASAVFHYDWTYSTPFVGTMEGGTWNELDESGMRMELLTDQSIPILFFDEIVLFEDDLHDNGQVHYTVKLRVMPTCAYVLARLYMRVDNVIVRLRETRVLVDFFGIKKQIYRDVTWRECVWEKLADHNLPTDVRPWVHDGKDTSSWHKLVRALPEIDPPEDCPKYTVLEY